ncbi:putative metabolite transport protein [Lachnellula willkommii]|uniref:Putative metabolite transport protein n=1 Tax=Lachnellula willkommii TaxID=215461 RepID=A0A559MD89_9HELO|nr:putative metabolite transport protein [Lachnellula willkommii]
MANEPKPLTTHESQLQHGELAQPADYVDLNANVGAKIKNPLAGISQETLLRNVEVFAQEKGLSEHTAILQKGALVAQDPANYEDITGQHALTPDEVDQLRNEVLHKWRHPWALYVTIFTCSIGAAVQGWDQTGSNGANLSFPQVFGIGSDSTKDKLLVGLVNGAPYIGSAFVGCWVSDPLNFYLGRRGTIFIAAIFCFLPIIGSAFSQTWRQLFVCRLLLGFGMGAKGSTVPIYAAENSPAAIRGALVMSWQLWTAFEKNRYPQAFKSLLRLRNDPLQAARDMYYIHCQLEIEKEIIGSSNYITRFTQLFTVPRIRRATLASFTVMIAQQMCGINIIAFYSSTIFANSGFSPYQALFASWGFGLINFLFAFPALWTIDTYGRRTLLLFTFPNMAWSLLAAGLCSLINIRLTAHLALVAMFIYIFAIFYSPGEGPVPFTYSAEVFPLSHRELGMGWAVATCLFWACVLTLFLPLMLTAMNTVGVFGFYAGTNVIALVMIFLWVPETKQRTLEELDYIFAVPTRTHMRYQTFTVLPWWFNTWIMRRDVGPLEPLYKFEDSANDQDKIDAMYAADKVRADRKAGNGNFNGVGSGVHVENQESTEKRL